MFFILSKVLAFLLMPVTWLFILLIWSWLTKDADRKRRLRIAAVVVLAIFSNRFLLDRVMHAWEVNAVAEPPKGSYDAIIVLGGVSSWDDQLQRIQFSRGSDRLMQAVALWRKGVAPKLVFTGGSGSVRHQEYREGVFVQQYLRSIGMPDSAMVFETKSRNTHENAAFTKPLLASDAPGGKYLLVTSAYHMRRSLGCFEKEGIHVVPYSTDRYSGPMRYDLDYLLLPDSAPLSDWEILMHEWFGCITYKMSGYL
jgi:uncharacterized SAM-binding protein YcdF (DUF218 family)